VHDSGADAGADAGDNAINIVGDEKARRVSVRDSLNGLQVQVINGIVSYERVA
jgi:hypothetical protein